MSQRFRQPETKPKNAVHPIWRGIGCLLMIIIPLMSFAASTLLAKTSMVKRYFPMSPEIATRVNVPGFGSQPLLYLMVITAIVTVLGYIALTIAYAFVFRLGSGSRYGPLDVPPIKNRKVRKSR
jgi:hypothetical protein